MSRIVLVGLLDEFYADEATGELRGLIEVVDGR